MKVENKVVCTGMGAITSLGASLDDLIKKLGEAPKEENFTGGCLLESTSARNLGKCQIPRTVFLNIQGEKYIDRCTKLLYSACRQFLTEDDNDMMHLEGASISVGTAFSTLSDYMKLLLSFEEGGLQGVAPILFPNTVHNCPASQLAIMLKATGVNITNANGQCAGSDALANGFRLLRKGSTEKVLAGGVDEYSKYSEAGFYHCLKGRGGADFYVSESAAVVLLEEKQKALERNASILGEIVAYSQGFHPDVNNNGFTLSNLILKTMNQAINNANLDPEEIRNISLSICGIPRLDNAELEAVGKLLSNSVQPKGLFALKKVLGETMGASGILQLQVAIHRPDIPLRAHYATCFPDPFVQAYISVLADSLKDGFVLINNLNWEGNITTLVVKPYETTRVS